MQDNLLNCNVCATCAISWMKVAVKVSAIRRFALSTQIVSSLIHWCQCFWTSFQLLRSSRGATFNREHDIIRDLSPKRKHAILHACFRGGSLFRRFPVKKQDRAAQRLRTRQPQYRSTQRAVPWGAGATEAKNSYHGGESKGRAFHSRMGWLPLPFWQMKAAGNLRIQKGRGQRI